MAGIWIAASIATLVSVCGIGFLIAKTSAPDDGRFLTLVALLSLPMWFVAFYLIRLPMDSALTSLLGTGATTTAFLFATTILYAPVTEEVAKLWLVIFRWLSQPCGLYHGCASVNSAGTYSEPPVRCEPPLVGKLSALSQGDRHFNRNGTASLAFDACCETTDAAQMRTILSGSSRTRITAGRAAAVSPGQ